MTLPPIGPSGASQLDELAIERARQANAILTGVDPVVNPEKTTGENKRNLFDLKEKMNDAGEIADMNSQKTDKAIDEINQESMMNYSNSYFDLSKFAQSFGEQVMGQDPLSQSDPGASSSSTTDVSQNGESLNFNSPEELKSWLETNASNPEMINKLLEMIPQDSEYTEDSGINVNTRQFVKDCAQRFAESLEDESQKMILAAQIYDKISGKTVNNESAVTGTLTQADVDALVKESNQVIMNAAFKAASSSSKMNKKSFNLKKQAQVVGFTDFVNFGPSLRSRLQSIWIRDH
jgi:transcription-repair coupling factor (superfamily II helicase)